MRLQTLGNMDIQWENHLRQVRGTHENRRGRMMKYKILRAGEMKDLQRKVRVEIREGWAPLGGVSVCGGYGHAHFHQAMTKEASQ